jgi:hypothetical protein
MNLTAEQIKENYVKFRQLISDEFSESPRLQNLQDMYDAYEDQLVLAPASAIEHFHNAFPGGYVEHVLRVVQISKQFDKLWKMHGIQTGYSQEELVFAALHHDLGKLGMPGKPAYIPNDSEWHRKNQGQIYKINEENSFMSVPDRSLFVLQQYEIAVSETEYLAIKLHDGVYDDANKPYLMSFKPSAKLKTSLPYVLHQADFLASQIEYNRWLNFKNVKA